MGQTAAQVDSADADTNSDSFTDAQPNANSDPKPDTGIESEFDRERESDARSDRDPNESRDFDLDRNANSDSNSDRIGDTFRVALANSVQRTVATNIRNAISDAVRDPIADDDSVGGAVVEGTYRTGGGGIGECRRDSDADCDIASDTDIDRGAIGEREPDASCNILGRTIAGFGGDTRERYARAERLSRCPHRFSGSRSPIRHRSEAIR